MQVVDFKQPDELRSVIDITLGQDGASEQEVLELCRKALQYSVRTGSDSQWYVFLTDSYSTESHTSLFQPTLECLTPCGLEWTLLASVVLL